MRYFVLMNRGDGGLRWTCLVLIAIAACGTPPTTTTNVLHPKNANATEDSAAARLARIEHGLIPEVRVKGERRGAFIEDELRAHHTPGISIAIIHDYRVVSAKAYGLADATTGTRLTETTLMHAASVSKMFTATAALKEVDAGKIPLDANVNQTLRSWHLPENELTRVTPVTLKELLSHSGGTTVPTLLQDEHQPTLAEVLDGKPPAINRPVRVDLAPGTRFRYSGGGTTVVQQMLVDVEGGRPFPEIMNDLVLAPLKLAHSTFLVPTKSPERWPLVSSGHDFDGTVQDKSFQPWAGGGGSGLWSTPRDIAQLLIEVQLGLRGRAAAVSKELASRMTTPVITTSKGDITTTTAGAFAEKHGTSVYFGHDGHGIGFLTISRASTTSGEGAVVMANGASGAPVMLEVLRSIAAEYAWDGWLMPPIDVAHVDAAHLKDLSGRYGGEKTESLFVTVKGDHLEARQTFRETLDLLPVSSDVFISREDGTKITFTKNGSTRSLIRSPAPWPPPPPEASVTLTRLPEGAPEEPLQILEAGKADEALATSKRMLDANPKDPTLDENQIRSVGEDLLEQLDPKRALAVFELNLALHPDSPMACVNAAEALFRSGRLAEALPLYTKTKTLFASTGDAMSEYTRANVQWRLSRLKSLDAAR